MTKLPEKKKRPTSVVVGPSTEATDYLGIQELFGIRRALAYHLYQTGAIKSFSLKEPGEKRGKRLFDVASIREFLNSKLENEQPAAREKRELVRDVMSEREEQPARKRKRHNREEAAPD